VHTEKKKGELSGGRKTAPARPQGKNVPREREKRNPGFWFLRPCGGHLVPGMGTRMKFPGLKFPVAFNLGK